ncbi:MAG: tRNA (N6-threonylcarbamoyladenosine(37)-N6)-methyltransferase TrmO [Ruminococcus sp.]|nr:tRNA (N6-threonylcarbamoyladenosine(37)-N6)-methyltransferase TrmO [Ruminococcus sp.]
MVLEIKPIAVIENDFDEKFGVPRQAGLHGGVSRIVFLPEYRIEEALRGIEGFSHIWLLWEFGGFSGGKWSPTVRPPRLGGNKRMGVFATRSPNRPNGIGLSSVRLTEVRRGTAEGTVLYVAGADMMNGTKIYDIKPYLPYTDCHPEAASGFALTEGGSLAVEIPEDMGELLTAEQLVTLKEILSQDPRPGYQDDPERVYTMAFGGNDVSFTAEEGKITVTGIRKK